MIETANRPYKFQRSICGNYLLAQHEGVFTMPVTTYTLSAGVASFELQLFSNSPAIGILLSLKTVYSYTSSMRLIKTFDYTVN